MTITELPNFNHNPPKNYHYEIELFKTNVFAIWLCCNHVFDYNNGEKTRTIWGFFDRKKSKYFSPVNSKKIGKEVQIQNTRSWTSMPIMQTPLEAAFL